MRESDRTDSASRVASAALSKWLLAGISLILSLLPTQTSAFSLLGPYTEWMDVQKGYRQPGDIGGPMNIDEGYRWNIPVITYGFDRSFLDYFGSTAIPQIL